MNDDLDGSFRRSVIVHASINALWNLNMLGETGLAEENE